MADAMRQATTPLMQKEVDMYDQRERYHFAGLDEKTADSMVFGYRHVHFIANFLNDKHMKLSKRIETG